MRNSKFRFKPWLITKLLSTFLFLVLVLFPLHSTSSEETQPVQRAELPLILQKIAFCESEGKQFNTDGSVIRGKENPQDVGKFQINEHYHLAASKKLGMDIYTLEGNTDYALYLYNKNGTRDWNWSKPCWNK